MILPRTGRGRLISTIARQIYSGAGRVIPADFLGVHLHRYPVGDSFTFTVNTTSNNVVVAHNNRGNYDWMHCYLTTTGTLPAPLVAGGQYWNLPVDSGNVQLSLTQGGPAIDITDSGSGTHTIEFRAPGPTYSFGHWRTVDGLLWRNLHTADDTYDTAQADAHFVPVMNAGAKIMWNLFSTPTWASSNSGAPGVYGNGDTYPPVNISSATGPLKEFLTWLLGRYNTAAGGVFGTDAARIKWIEVWNEPAFPGAFYAGTASELAQIAKAAADVAAGFPGVQVIAPGWGGGATLSNATASTSAVKQFFEASDGAGGVGADHVTGFAWHPYGYGLGGSDVSMIAQDAWARQIAARYGLTTLHASEWGDFPHASGAVVFSAEARATVMRTIAMQAALGWDTTTIYSHDNQIAFVAPVADAEMSALLGEFSARVVGKTLVDAAVLYDKRVRMEFSDGSVYTSPAQ